MLPQGARPAQTPRSTTPTSSRQERQPGERHADVRGPATRLDRARRSAGGRVMTAVPPAALDDRARTPRPAVRRRPAAKDDGEEDHRDRQGDHRGVDRRVARLRQLDARHGALLSSARRAPRGASARDVDIVGEIGRLGLGQARRPARGYLPRRRPATLTHSRRRRTNSDSISPAMAASEASSASSLPGSWAIWNDAHRSKPVNSTEPAPVGQRPRLAREAATPGPSCVIARRVERVDALRAPVVEPEVAAERGQEHRRVVRRRGRSSAVRVPRSRAAVGRNSPLSPSDGVASGHLDHAGRGEVAVLRQEHHGVVEDDAPGRVADDEARGVAVPDEEDLGAVDVSGSLTSIVVATGSRRGSLAVGDVRLEQARRAALGLPALEVDGERVEREGERRESVRARRAGRRPRRRTGSACSRSPSPSRTMTLPFQPSSPPTAHGEEHERAATRWKTRLPVSRE